MKFVPNINKEHAQDYSCPWTTSAFCSHGEKLPRLAGYPLLHNGYNQFLKSVAWLGMCMIKIFRGAGVVTP